MAELAAIVAKSLQKKEKFKVKNQLKKMADRSLIKFSVGGLASRMKAIMYEYQGEKFIDFVEEMDDGTIPPNKRATLPFDALYILEAVMPDIIRKLQEETLTDEILLHAPTDMYLITSKVKSNQKLHLRTKYLFHASFRQKFETDEGMTGVVSKKNFVLSEIVSIF